jgi:ethanolamine utilization cobalamin adenosyltransferase
MSRQPEVEAILRAWYDLETCAPSDKTSRIRHLNDLLDQAITKADIKGVSRNELKELLAEPYREFKHTKRMEERAKLSRLR